MSHDYRNLERAITSLLESLAGVLTDSETGEVQQFLDAGEYGVAFETLCCILKDGRKAITARDAEQIRVLAEEMEIDEGYWRAITGP